MIWLERRDVEAFHAAQISEFGGLAGLRDENGLGSAVAKARNLSAYGEPTIHELAAAYAFGIARNHPFADGNKRTAMVSSFTFLELNGYEVTADEADAVLTFLALAAGKLGQDALASWLEANSARRRRKR
jgi:death on curing protein